MGDLDVIEKQLARIIELLEKIGEDMPKEDDYGAVWVKNVG